MKGNGASQNPGPGTDPGISPEILAGNLLALEVDDLGPESLKDSLEECVRLERFAQAKRTEILAAFGTVRSNDWRLEPGRQPADRIAENMSPIGSDEIAPILDVAPRTAATELYNSMRARSCMPRTLDGLKAGKLSARRFREIVTRTCDLPGDVADEADREVTGWNPDGRFQTFRTKLARWVAVHDTRKIADKHADVHRDRIVDFSPDDNGAAQLFAYGPADALRALFNKLDHAARAGRDRAGGADTRTLAQRRFDALTDATIHHDDHAPVEAQECRLNVTVPVFALLGWNDPGNLEGYGPIPASMARRLAAGSSTWTRLLTDPVTCRIINADPKRYRPNAALRLLVRARDGTCQFPGCTVPASACQIDHPPPQSGGRCPQTICPRWTHHRIEPSMPV